MNKETDVIILGSGLAGSVLATILAKQGHSVCMIERGAHPRFALGEAMQPQSTIWLWMLGEHYNIPELVDLAYPPRSRHAFAKSCGIKRSFGFAYHQQGREQLADHGRQLIPPELPVIRESHFFREQVDHFMVQTAESYGVEYLENTELGDIDLGDDEVTVTLEDGGAISGKFFVDCTGKNSKLVEMLSLREEPTRFKTNSRTIFSHFKNIPAYDEIGPSEGLSRSLHEGTMHHVFEGGWFWIIPFNNEDGSNGTNELCSVGVTLDAGMHPATDMSPEDEFYKYVNEFPSVKEHLRNAESTRPFISTGRLQYSAKNVAGKRWAIMSNVYGFVDPLFSTGLISSFNFVHFLASRLDATLKQNHFSEETFSDMNQLAKSLDATDAFVADMYRSTIHPQLWNAMIMVWTALGMIQDLWAFGLVIKYITTRNPDLVPMLRDSSAYSEFTSDLTGQATRVLDDVEQKEMSPEAGAARIFEILGEAEYLPREIVHLHCPETRGVDLNIDKILRVIKWGKNQAPEPMRSRMFNIEIRPMVVGMLSMSR